MKQTITNIIRYGIAGSLLGAAVHFGAATAAAQATAPLPNPPRGQAPPPQSPPPVETRRSEEQAVEIPSTEQPPLRQFIEPPGSGAQRAPRDGRESLPSPRQEFDRDPTTVSPDLRLLLDANNDDKQDDELVMRICGRVSKADGSTVAIVDINGGLYTVLEGSRIDAPLQAGSTSLIIEILTPTDMEIRLEQMDRTFRLR